MSKPKGPFEAAVRAAAEAIEDCEWDAKYLARTVLSAALSPDPAPDEVSEAIGLAVHDVHEFPAKTYLARVGQAARRAVRASLLPGEG